MYSLQPNDTRAPGKCPKCRHVRRPDDDAPAWQCPQCGIAYAKFGNDTSSDKPAQTAAAVKRAAGTGNRGMHPAVLVLAVLIAVSIFAAFKLGSGSTDRTRLMSEAGSRVVIFGTPSCPYCARARAFFARNGIKYFEYNVETSAEGQRKFRQLNGRGVPLILIGDQRIDGYSERALKTALTREGLM